MTDVRFTDFVQSTSEDDAVSEWDKYLDETGGYAQGKRKPALWVGATYLFTKTCKDPKVAVASIKRDKNDAKKKAKSSRFQIHGPIVQRSTLYVQASECDDIRYATLFAIMY